MVCGAKKSSCQIQRPKGSREWLNSLGFMYHTKNAAIHLQRSGIDVTKWTAAELCDRYLVQLKTKFDKFKNLTAGRMEEDIRQLKLGQGLSDPWTYQVKPSLQFYFDNHGDLMVPHNYVIPSTENVPGAIHGLKLGQRVVGMRNRSLLVRSKDPRGAQRMAQFLRIHVPH